LLDVDPNSVILTEAELLEMIERADTDQDGEISPEEFFVIMTKKTVSWSVQGRGVTSERKGEGRLPSIGNMQEDIPPERTRHYVVGSTWSQSPLFFYPCSHIILSSPNWLLLD
jgi:hypothetical protein